MPLIFSRFFSKQKAEEKSTVKNLDMGSAHITSYEIKRCRESLSDIIIAPFDQNKAKGIGYNFSLSEMVYSITRKKLVPICRGSDETYFFLRKHETVLVLSYEYLKVGECIAGSFHSRVRMTAKGIGNTSTTLDPNWKGMLLFSLNNPTNKKIKITVATRINGINTPHSAITLVAWRTAQLSPLGLGGECLPLGFDNPPMRTDIWTELTIKQFRLFNNNEYQRFKKLVDSISRFEPTVSLLTSELLRVKSLLVELMIAIKKEDANKVREILYKLKYIQNLNNDVLKRISKLVAILSRKDYLNICIRREYIRLVELTIRETEYQILCEEVIQTHEYISKHVPVSWRTNIGANLLYQLSNNVGSVIATVILILIAILGKYTNTIDFWQRIAISFVPLAVSIFSNLLLKRK